MPVAFRWPCPNAVDHVSGSFLASNPGSFLASVVDVMSYLRSYQGRRRGRRVKWCTRISMRHAVHAWACALRELGLLPPPWRPNRRERRLSSLLAAYAQHRRSHRGIATSTLAQEINLAEQFLSHLR